MSLAFKGHFVQNSCHPFYAGFRKIARFHRYIGTCFLENLNSNDYRDVRCNRRSFYLIYLISLWSFILGIAVGAYVATIEPRRRMKDTDRLNTTIYILFLTSVNVEAVINNFLMFVKAPKFVELLHLCAKIEMNIGTPPYVQHDTISFTWKIMAFQAVLSCCNFVLNIISDFGTALVLSAEGQVSVDVMVIGILYSILGVVYVSSLCLVTRLWMTYFSKAFTLYLSCIYRNLDQCLRSRSTPESRKVSLVDHTRVQLTLLKNCADLASSLLGPSLLYAYAYSVALLCAAAYYTIIPELSNKIRLFFLCFGVLHWISILLPTVSAHRIKGAVIELRSIVQGVSMADFSDDLLAQLRMMLNSIRHDDLKFTGCGFFVVDLSTFADIMGAVITYTVVLVQTNDSYLKGSLEHCLENSTII
ncbi:uncharacterized protein LOC121048660 [Ixodes scapularis]|uniref:uncharacterized protein LOC121048660 n=1 Tax=Ixodes scapularis TaxID=6945 RepID=UPI001AD6C79B|nr:uncharacterized protein LOC121048660 [Ixodes scapularis]